MTIDEYYAVHAVNGRFADLVDVVDVDDERVGVAWVERTETGGYDACDYNGIREIAADQDVDDFRDDWCRRLSMDGYEYSVHRSINPWVVRVKGAMQ